MAQEAIIVIRGGGDLATGVIQKFYRSGYRVLVLETEQPTAIRCSVSVCEAVYYGKAQVEDVPCVRVSSRKQIEHCWELGQVPLLIDPEGKCIGELSPQAVIDAILAKRNLGTHRAMAPITIGLGPGFYAGREVDAVIETMRGHNLGRLLLEGEALPNTGIPGEMGGKSAERVIHAPLGGIIKHGSKIGDIVEQGAPFMSIDEIQIKAPFRGLLRGLIHEGLFVPQGMKIADIDPRIEVDWRTISDKARCLGGAALEAYLYLRKEYNL
ncbi:MAG: selenium-dependent molybdenum cofactor biosynthesis protein YqeB [Lachnospiraceae bacterium]